MNPEYWKKHITNQSVLEWVEHGVPALFESFPQPFCCHNRKFNKCEAEFIDQEISRLLKNNYISIGESEFISAINVVPKQKTFRLVTDLRVINAHSQTKTFRNENIDDVVEAVKPDDLLVTFDIKDGFFNIPLRKEDSKYFAFKWKNNVYCWNVLCFGWSLSPYYFCKIIRAFIGYLRQNDVRIVSYVDDFILSAGVLHIESQKQFALCELKKFGFSLNEPKSQLTPSNKKKFIGFLVETDPNAKLVKISIPRDRITKVKKDIRRALKAGKVSARFLACIAGQLISMTKAILPTKLILRNVYRLLGTKKDWKDTLYISKAVQHDLNWWLEALSNWNGKAFSSLTPEWVTIETDASLEGWGASLTDNLGMKKQAQGFWSPNMRQKHSNEREMTAVFLGLKTFLKEVTGKSVLILSDNISTVAYINMQGGSSQNLSNIATNIWTLLVENQIHVQVRHLSGIKNVIADQLSRLSSQYEWMLSPALFRYLDWVWGPHTCDRFASHLTCQISNYNSFHADPATSGIDALVQMDWGKQNNFVNAPLRLLDRVINTIITQKATATIIAPEWLAMQWCRKLRLLSISPPIRLPKAKHFCIPIGMQVPEPLRNKKWKWFAWRVAG